MRTETEEKGKLPKRMDNRARKKMKSELADKTDGG